MTDGCRPAEDWFLRCDHVEFAVHGRCSECPFFKQLEPQGKDYKGDPIIICRWADTGYSRSNICRNKDAALHWTKLCEYFDSDKERPS